MKSKYEFTPIEQSLLARNIITIKGDIDLNTFRYVRDAMLLLEMKNVTEVIVRISSGGGEESSGLAIYDLLVYYSEKINFTGVAMSACNSMASIILQACQKRLALKHATMLIHFPSESNVPVTDYFDTDIDRKKLAVRMAGAQAHRQIFINVYKRCGKSDEDIEALLRESRDIRATEALAIGLLDKIIEKESEVSEGTEKKK